MKIRLNENEKVVKMVKEGLKKKNGYCPCRLEMNEDTKCMCKEFREQIADENFEGYCHCMLYCLQEPGGLCDDCKDPGPCGKDCRRQLYRRIFRSCIQGHDDSR